MTDVISADRRPPIVCLWVTELCQAAKALQAQRLTMKRPWCLYEPRLFFMCSVQCISIYMLEY